MKLKSSFGWGRKSLFGVLCASLLFSSFLSSVRAEEVSDFPQKKQGWNLKELALTPIHAGGRLKPLDSYAREAMLMVTSSRSFKGWDPVELALSWIAFPSEWEKAPFVSVGMAEVRRQLGLDESRSRFSPTELLQDSYLAQYANSMGSEKSSVPNLSGGIAKQDPRQKELKTVVERLQTYRAYVSGEAWLVIPQTPPAKWSNLAENDEVGQPLRSAFAKLVDAYREGKQAEFETTAREIRLQVEQGWQTAAGLGAAATRPRELSVLTAEYWYNRTHPFYYGWIFYLVAALAWSAAIVTGSRWARVAAWSSTWAGTLALIAGISLRVYIAGRPPVSNMYESIIWVAFGVMLFGGIIYWTQRQAIILAVATAVACLSLIAADAAPAIMDPGIHPLVPVLRSNYWLLVHVLTITLSYSALALTMGLGNVTLWQFYRKARDPKLAGATAKISNLNQLTYRAMQFGVGLLAAGIILGGVWADYSWGRFWGWDPKEVWALIALLGYIAILHARYVAWVGQFGFAAWTVLSFMLVVMAWYGVNFILGVGLHSYGFSTGGRGTVAAFCGLQLAYVAWVTWRHRRARTTL